jgi:hypothetical protein
MSPLTSSLVAGDEVPIPTFPLEGNVLGCCANKDKGADTINIRIVKMFL